MTLNLTNYGIVEDNRTMPRSFSRRRILGMAGGAFLAACAAPARPGDALVPLYANPARDE
jgi:hypothetical protein